MGIESQPKKNTMKIKSKHMNLWIYKVKKISFVVLFLQKPLEEQTKQKVLEYFSFSELLKLCSLEHLVSLHPRVSLLVFRDQAEYRNKSSGEELCRGWTGCFAPTSHRCSDVFPKRMENVCQACKIFHFHLKSFPDRISLDFWWFSDRSSSLRTSQQPSCLSGCRDRVASCL